MACKHITTPFPSHSPSTEIGSPIFPEIRNLWTKIIGVAYFYPDVSFWMWFQHLDTFNDVIFEIPTTRVPKPATTSFSTLSPPPPPRPPRVSPCPLRPLETACGHVRGWCILMQLECLTTVIWPISSVQRYEPNSLQLSFAAGVSGNTSNKIQAKNVITYDIEFVAVIVIIRRSFIYCESVSSVKFQKRWVMITKILELFGWEMSWFFRAPAFSHSALEFLKTPTFRLVIFKQIGITGVGVNSLGEGDEFQNDFFSTSAFLLLISNICKKKWILQKKITWENSCNTYLIVTCRLAELSFAANHCLFLGFLLLHPLTAVLPWTWSWEERQDKENEQKVKTTTVFMLIL